jgi:ribosomal-protein-alanine N-acetyltransferase
MIETERLILRKFTIDDVEESYQMNKDPTVQRYLPSEGPLTRKNVEHMIKNNVLADYKEHGFGRLAVIHKQDNRFIGFTGLKYVPEFDAVDIGYRLNSAYWGQGLATESALPTIEYGFKVLKLPRIVAAAIADNQGSIRVMEKLGMHFEKTLELDGHPCVYYVMENPELSGQDRNSE